MDIKQGDSVKVDGKVAKVQTFWNQGRHRIFKLDDGREVMDLHKSVEAGHVQIIADVPPTAIATPSAQVIEDYIVDPIDPPTGLKKWSV